MRHKNIVLCLLSIFVITVCTQDGNTSWKESETYKVGLYTMRGEENKLGFIDANFEAGKAQKYMWHFWPEEKVLDGPFKVVAVKEYDKHEFTIFEAPSLGGPMNGANAHMPSLMQLPEKGMWRLDAYINDNLFGSVYIRVV